MYYLVFKSHFRGLFSIANQSLFCRKVWNKVWSRKLLSQKCFFYAPTATHGPKSDQVYLAVIYKKNWWSTIWCVGLFTGLCKSYYLTTINCCISWTNIFLYYHHQRISTSCNQTTDFMDEHHVGCCCKFVYRFRHVSNVWQYSEWRRFPNIFTEGRFKGNMLSILPVNEVCGKMS